ncbi:MAG: hypothetical protein ACLQNG_14275 [Acidimicrobiales bacterium]
MGRESERELGDPPGGGAAGDSLEGRLSALEAAVEEVRRRQVVAELRSDPAHLLSGVAETRRIVRQDLDDLAETLARWDVPLSPADELELQRVALVAQGLSGARRATVHLVVDVAGTLSPAGLERLAAAAHVLSSRSRRTVPVIVALRPPTLEQTERAAALGVEIVLPG